jgi:cytochrome c nitrite reductase small subunit
MDVKRFFDLVCPSLRGKVFLLVLCGIVGGLGAYTLYASRAWGYLSDEPSACVNCHIMGPFYATWSHGSHGRDATCNDCHVPHEGVVRKWMFKGMDGVRHAAVFTLRGERQVIQATEGSDGVIMRNCVRCHTELNTEFVKTGRLDYKAVMLGGGKACWDCHRDVAHGGGNSLSSTPSAIVPYPGSKVPDWLGKKRISWEK